MTTIVSISALGASLVIAIVIIAFAASANAAGTNATRVATSAKKSSQIGEEYYDSIPTGGKELEEFMAIGGTFIMPAVNSTHLYREIKKVYDKLPEDVARYLALQINSGAAREEFSNDALIKLVKKHSARNWRELCMDYTWEWSSRVGGIGMSIELENELLPATFAHEDINLSQLDSIAMCDENEAFYDAVLEELDGMVVTL